MAIPLRGVKNIHTLAGRVDGGARPYRGFMQITCLEMEKARRLAERNSAAARIRDIDGRLEDIEKEKQVLLAKIASPTLPAGPAAPKPVRGFRIRYGGRP